MTSHHIILSCLFWNFYILNISEFLHYLQLYKSTVPYCVYIRHALSDLTSCYWKCSISLPSLYSAILLPLTFSHINCYILLCETLYSILYFCMKKCTHTAVFFSIVQWMCNNILIFVISFIKFSGLIYLVFRLLDCL